MLWDIYTFMGLPCVLWIYIFVLFWNAWHRRMCVYQWHPSVPSGLWKSVGTWTAPVMAVLADAGVTVLSAGGAFWPFLRFTFRSSDASCTFFSPSAPTAIQFLYPGGAFLGRVFPSDNVHGKRLHVSFIDIFESELAAVPSSLAWCELGIGPWRSCRPAPCRRVQSNATLS